MYCLKKGLCRWWRECKTPGTNMKWDASQVIQMFMCDEQVPPVHAALGTATAVKNNICRREDDTGLLCTHRTVLRQQVIQGCMSAVTDIRLIFALRCCYLLSRLAWPAIEIPSSSCPARLSLPSLACWLGSRFSSSRLIVAAGTLSSGQYEQRGATWSWALARPDKACRIRSNYAQTYSEVWSWPQPGC